MQHTSIDVYPYAFLPVRITNDRGQGRGPWLNAALAGLLHHVAAHVAGSTGTDAERSNSDALLGQRSSEIIRNAASDVLATQHPVSGPDDMSRPRPQRPTEEPTRRTQWTGAAAA